MNKAVVIGSFDNLQSSDIRFLEEASRQGELHVFVWADALATLINGCQPEFPLEERIYLLHGIRYVNQVHVVEQLDSQNTFPLIPCHDNDTTTWVVPEAFNNGEKHRYCLLKAMQYHVVEQALIKDFPNAPNLFENPSKTKRVLVTGCYDWFHSGHLRFFEEVAQLGELYVVVGSDENVRLLKGEGHPLFPQDERRYVVGSIRFVKQTFISTGSGWMDVGPEIELIKPDIYAVNEDGDKPEKRRFCEEHGLQYVVLKRLPRDGLPKRESTQLRGF